MKKMLRWLAYGLSGLVVLVALAAGLLAYFVYVPEPAAPQLSGTVTKGSIEVAGLQRTYRTYVPRGLKPGAPLVLVMHGSGENGGQVRTETGYGFDRLADQNGYAVVYPDSYSFDWNDCSTHGDFSVNGRLVDDVGFLNAMVDKLVPALGIDPGRVFATGVSAGGFMSLRLALEAPARYRAVAAVSANLPAPENFKCRPVAQTIPVMFMNGTKDPLVPFDGGEVNLLGMFYKGGRVLSSRESVQYFADRNRLSGAPSTSSTELAPDVGIEQVNWSGAHADVELVAVRGGGHGLPQAYARRPRLLGPSPMAPDGPAMIWHFFARQLP